MKELIAALLEIQKDLSKKPIKKDSTARVPTKGGGAYSYNYISLGSLLDIIRPISNKHGVVISQNSYFEPINGVLFCCCDTTLSHFSGEEKVFKSRIPYEKFERMNTPQSSGSHFTYCARYALSSIFAVASEEDNDAQGDHEQPKVSNQPKEATETATDDVYGFIFNSSLNDARKNEMWKQYQEKPDIAKHSFFENFIKWQVKNG